LAPGGVTPHLGYNGAIALQLKAAALGGTQTCHHGPVSPFDSHEGAGVED
jgi:hypothetical protein